MNQILTIVGARPQFIKASVVSKALFESGVQEEIIHTGQRRIRISINHQKFGVLFF